MYIAVAVALVALIAVAVYRRKIENEAKAATNGVSAFAKIAEASVKEKEAQGKMKPLKEFIEDIRREAKREIWPISDQIAAEMRNGLLPPDYETRVLGRVDKPLKAAAKVKQDAAAALKDAANEAHDELDKAHDALDEVHEILG